MTMQKSFRDAYGIFGKNYEYHYMYNNRSWISLTRGAPNPLPLDDYGMKRDGARQLSNMDHPFPQTLPQTSAHSPGKRTETLRNVYVTVKL